MKELRDILRAFQGTTSDMALATLVDTLGSSSRKPGARMLVMPDGRTIGTLGGGGIEEEVAQRSASVPETGVPVQFWLDTQKRFGRNGSIQIFIERIRPGNTFMGYLGQCIAERKPALAVVCMEHDPARSGSVPRHLAGRGRGGFEEIILPPVRLIVVGDNPGNDALLGFARLLGWSAVVSAPADLHLFDADERTAVVIQNHRFTKDLMALKWALSQPLGYIGLVGSDAPNARLRESLLAEGCEPEWIERSEFHHPAGLDIGASLPEETALSLVAEIQAVMTRREGGFRHEGHAPAVADMTSAAKVH